MTTLLQRATIASNVPFRGRVMMAAVLVSLEVFAEAGDVYEHNTRMNFARLVMNSPTDQQIKLAASVCSSDAIVDAEVSAAGTALDADIMTKLRDCWNPLAGVPNG